MLGYLFKYEDDKLYKKWKNGNKWTCCNDLKSHPTGYVRVEMDGKGVMLHRLVYLFHNPEWNISDICRDNSIDHINEKPLDNRIENLRVVTHSQNRQNITHMNGKPVKGVYFDNTHNRWGARWKVNGKQKAKYFKTEAEAVEHRAKMVKLHYTHSFTKRDSCSSQAAPSAPAQQTSFPELCAPSLSEQVG